MSHNLFNSLQTFSLAGSHSGKFYSLPQLEKEGVAPISQLPVSIRIVLESVLRNCDGKKITGVQRGFDNFSAQFMDAQDNYHSFFKTDVKSMTREFKSLMPAYTSLSAAEMNDLVAYLHSLGREARP